MKVGENWWIRDAWYRKLSFGDTVNTMELEWKALKNAAKFKLSKQLLM
jgi:hypothetical protein